MRSTKLSAIETLVVLALVFCSLAALSGCFGRKSKQTVAKKAADEQRHEEKDSKDSSGEDEDSKDPIDDDNSSEGETSDSESQPAESDTETEGETDAGPKTEQAPKATAEFGVERVCMLTEKGPILIDLWLTIDGTPHRDALRTLIQSSLSAADTDEDGRPTWDELTKSDQFRYGRTGNLEIRSDDERTELVRMYDSDRDGTVDEDELPRFLTRNAGGSRPFNLKSSNYYRQMNRIDSPIRRLLDQDRDGVVSNVERASAGTVLRSRDADQNDILLPNEFLIDEDASPSPLTLNRPSNPDSVVWISDVRQWGNFHYTLRERYALGRSLVASQFSAAPSLFTALDANNDSEIDSNEMAEIANVEPHIILAVRFGNVPIDDTPSDDTPPSDDAPSEDVASEDVAPEDVAPGDVASEDVASGDVAPGDVASENKERPLLELVYAAPEIFAGRPDTAGPLTVEKNGRVTISLAHTVLILFAYDAAGSEAVEGQVTAQFGQLDGDGNGYLDEEELPEDFFGFPSFAALDTDEDGKVFQKDILAFFESRQTAWRKQVRCRAGEAGDALFTALDSNDDGRLTTREIHNADSRLDSFDRARDGLSVSEIPDVMLLGVVRGDPQNDDNSFRQAMVAAPPSQQDLPDWFTSMDRNSDGDISEREFLGDETQFNQLDRNKDQFISAEELLEK